MEVIELMEQINATVSSPNNVLGIEVTECVRDHYAVTAVTLDLAMYDLAGEGTPGEREELQDSARKLARWLEVPLNVRDWTTEAA